MLPTRKYQDTAGNRTTRRPPDHCKQMRSVGSAPQSQLCVLTLTRCPFHPRVTTVARKRPRSFSQKCRWKIRDKHAYTLDPTKSKWSDYAVQACFGDYHGNELAHNSSGNTRPQSSQLAEPLWTYPGIKSGISVRELMSTFKKKKIKRRRGMNDRTFSQNSHKPGKSQHLLGINTDYWTVL